MKSKKVATVASDDEMVRLNIYDGEMPLEDARCELVRLECLRTIRDEKARLQRRCTEVVYELLAEDTPRAIYRLNWIRKRNRIYAVMKALRLLGGKGVHRPNIILERLGYEAPTWVGKAEFDKRVQEKLI